jgi:pimeloyl-ACP methyl ester carboxylesterase
VRVVDRGQPVTIVAFSGLSPTNWLFEWSTAFGDMPVNFVGVRDPFSCWYQRGRAALLDELGRLLDALPHRRLVCIGGSAGGFAALDFGPQLGADRIIAISPQSACGAAKRQLGDMRWPQFCEGTPSADIAGRYRGAIVHYAGDDELDALHAKRLDVDQRIWPTGGHDLPHWLKGNGKLHDVISEALNVG